MGRAVAAALARRLCAASSRRIAARLGYRNVSSVSGPAVACVVRSRAASSPTAWPSFASCYPTDYYKRSDYLPLYPILREPDRAGQDLRGVVRRPSVSAGILESLHFTFLK